MSDFKTSAATNAAAPDPTKHVNYSYGMVLGVDDLTQEFSYHAARDRWMMRDAVGYGTLSGLRVSVGEDKASGDVEVTVEAGTAVSPSGQLVRVAPRQCANLSKWLAFDKHREEIAEHVGVPPGGDVRLYVVLCYRDCPTDDVPIPGEPCRDESDILAPSRLRDDFRLELRFEPPAQGEEDALRDFVKWLREHVAFTDEADEADDLTDLETFVKRLRAAVSDPASPPSPPDFMLDSPPDVMTVAAENACAFLRAALRLWVTELRPLWRPDFFGGGSAGCADKVTPTREDSGDCLLLAELLVPIDSAGGLDAAKEIVIDESRRPIVVHLRMLQEWLTCGAFGGAVADAQPSPSSDDEPPTGVASAPVVPFVAVIRKKADPQGFQLWFQLDAKDNDVAVTSLGAGAVEAFAEIDVAGADKNYLKPLSLNVLDPQHKLKTSRRNRFDVRLSAAAADVVRLHFDMSRIRVLHAGHKTTLDKYVVAENVRYLGQSGRTRVTAFFPYAAEL
ncbi:MAG: hypothetical protein LC746_08615 [Acidobacteria bacterium]|nr:hypothetical protein [Acidobacteriota bacterium]